jgi:putative ABC transport system permease protein
VLAYSLRDLRREPRRALSPVIGVALGVGLFTAVLLFVDVSAASMTTRAIAPVAVDMYAQLSAPLASGLTLRETVAAPPSLAAGQTAVLTLVATNDGRGAASGVVVTDGPPSPLAYVAGTTTLNGAPVPDADDGRSALTSGLDAGALEPGASATVTYTVAAPARGVPAVRSLSLEGTVASRGDADPATANAPRRARLEEVRAEIARVPGIASADRMDIVDLPAGALGAGGAALSRPVRVFAFDSEYGVHHPDFHLTSGSFQPGSALLSDEASADLRVGAGGRVELTVPGSTTPVPLRIGGLVDLSAAASLFSSRSPDTLGDFIYVPDSIVISPELFESAILPALRADAAAADRAVTRPPAVEVDVGVDRTRLDAEPATALLRTRALTRTVGRIAPGQAVVIDNLSDTLTAAQGDAVAGTVMFLFLGLPGVLLAAFLSAYAGGLLARASRREHAILRTRGAQPVHLLRLLAWRTLVIAGSGSILGLGLGIAALAAAVGPGSFVAIRTGDLVLLGLLAAAAGVLTTALALYVPGRRALGREVAEEGRELESAAPPLWRRLWLDVALLAAAAVVEVVTYLGGGFSPSQTEGQAVSLSFYILLAPLMVWFGGSLLAVRALVRCARLLPAGDGRFGPVVRGVLRRSLRRRAPALAAGVLSVTLALAFGVSIAVFIASYDAQKAADARYNLGADLRVTPSALSPQPAGFADRLRVPGVASATAVDFHIGDAIFSGDTKDLAAVDPVSLPRTATLPNAFFLDGSATAAMAALRSDPAGILVDREMAYDFNLQVGDPVKVQLTDVSGARVTVTFHAVGRFTHFPGFPQNADCVANLDFLQRATGRTDADFFLVRASDSRDSAVAAIAASLRAGPGRDVPLRVETTATVINRDQSTLAALNLHGLGGLDLFFIALMSATAVGIFVVGLVLQRRREYVTLRALGLRLGQLQALLLGEVGVVAVCGLVIGALVGTGMALMFVQVLRPLFTHPVDGLTFPAASLIGLAALVLVTMTASALIASVILRRLRPMELLREE